MTEPTTSSPVETPAELESWRRSRSGAWAGRGFHYQYWVTVLVLLRQWIGQAPLGSVVPEGLDDCVIELAGRTIWLQAKSRKTGGFRDSEVTNFLESAESRVAKLSNAPAIRSAVILEQPQIDYPEVEFDRLFDDEAGRIFICQRPEHEVLRILSTRLRVASVIAQSLASDLYQLVVDASAANASLPFRNRRRISTNEVERLIFEHLEAADPTAIEQALLSGALEPVDFATPVNEPDFYKGVKVKPGHIAAGIVLDRPRDVHRILKMLWKKRRVLISGPSGAGKSALTWLAAEAAADQIRPFQITGIATAADAEAIVRFVRARRPSAKAPLCLVFDEVGSANGDLWDVLGRELRGLPDVYLLGSVRQEDVDLIADRSDTDFISISLDEDLARAVWKKLAEEGSTKWSHWREPFEQSEGLMLEYIHVLTQGQRLAIVIEDQVRQRESDRREDELAIIRSSAVLCAHGGDVEADRLIELLKLTPGDANRALKRLIDEHLVRESRPGVLGGLHMLRSAALVQASHDGIVFRSSDSLWKNLPATTAETLPGVVQSLMAETGDPAGPQALPELARILADSGQVEQWIAILTGLGLATLDRHVASFMSILERHGVERAHWSLAAGFADPLLDVPEISASEQWARLRDAISEFREMPKHDFRTECVAHLPAGITLPAPKNISQANQLLSSLVPICGGDPIPIRFRHDFLTEGEPDIRQVARLLSTAHLIDRNLADEMLTTLGGEQAMFDLFGRQVPWTTPPEIDPDGQHGRTVRSNWHQISEAQQPDPHETVCEICEILIGISPESDAAACDAVNPIGQVVTVGEREMWSKNIPRKNLPPKTRVAWNVAFRQILLARSAAYSLTDYTHQMADHVRKTERVFRSFSEAWIKGKRIPNADALASEINRILNAVNALSYAAPETVPSTMTEPVSAGTSEKLGDLLIGILGNLVGRMSKIETAKPTGCFAGNLHGQAQAHHHSAIWRTLSAPPLADLRRLADRLRDVSFILHEMAHNSTPQLLAPIIKAAKKARTRNVIGTIARRCRTRAERRFNDRLRKLETELAARGWNVRCLFRPMDKADSPFWPAREVAILVEVEDLAKQWQPFVEELLSVSSQRLANDWPFRVVPVMNGQILASQALIPTSHIPLPDQDFARDWADAIDQPMHASALLDQFEEALEAILQVSAIVNARGTQGLHAEESDLISRALDTFENRMARIEEASEQKETEHFALAADYLIRSWQRLGKETKAVNVGKPVENPICMTPHHAIGAREGEDVLKLAAVHLVLLQAECNRVTVV